MTIDSCEIDLLHDRVRCPACRRWVGRLHVMINWSLACTVCTAKAVRMEVRR